MSLKFEIQPAANPTPEKDRAAKLVDPGFGRIFTDHMAIVRYNQAKGWHDARVESRANFPLDPALAVLHYAQEIFEGLKAYKRDNGGVNLFRPDANARRFQSSADRMAMAPLPEAVFIEAVEQLVRIDSAWIPGGEGSLYLRPFMIASEIFLGVKPSAEYIFAVIASPVGSYFKGGPAPVSIWVSENYTRAAIGGTGAVKCGGNYAASLRAQAEAIEHGCDQVVFLDAVERRYVEELGGMNVFFVFDDGSLLTPPLGTILPGITRDSIIALAKDSGTPRARGALHDRAVAHRRRQRQAERGFCLRHRGRDLADRQGVFGERRFPHQRRRRRPRRHGNAQEAGRHPVRPRGRPARVDPKGFVSGGEPLRSLAPLLRGEGRGEGSLRECDSRYADTMPRHREMRLRASTSPRKRGEVEASHACRIASRLVPTPPMAEKPKKPQKLEPACRAGWKIAAPPRSRRRGDGRENPRGLSSATVSSRWKPRRWNSPTRSANSCPTRTGPTRACSRSRTTTSSGSRCATI